MKIYLLSLFTVMLVGCSTMTEVPLAAPLTEAKDKSPASLAGGKNAPTQAGLPTINSAVDDVSADKMELRGGLWYVKGESKPFTGKATLWTPGHGNEIARQVVKTYVNGKEKGSKVHILIGKRAPRPNR
jgi:hypothetical protein